MKPWYLRLYQWLYYSRQEREQWRHIQEWQRQRELAIVAKLDETIKRCEKVFASRP